jgi:hypothetical protein
MFLGSWIFFIPRCPSCSSRSASGDDQYSFCSWVAGSKMKLSTDSGGLLKDDSSSAVRSVRSKTLGLPRTQKSASRSSRSGPRVRPLGARMILHHLALNPGNEMIKVFIDARLIGLSPEDTDREGFTAEDYFSRHEDLQEDVAPLFKYLCRIYGQADMKNGGAALAQLHSPGGPS